MASPARFTKGVSNVAPNGCLSMFGGLDPTKYHLFFDDFDNYVAADWTVTETGVATQALADGDGGLLLVTNAALDNDASFQQKVGESFLIEAGKKAWFKTRFKVSDATQSDIAIGLQVTDTTPLAVTDGIWFRKDDGDALIDVVVQKDDTTGKNEQTSVATLVSDTFISLGWYYDGAGNLEVFVDDVKKATLTASSTYLPDTDLTVSFGIQNGEAVAKTMTLDYIFAAKER